ncbi:MAG: hypothetical protein GY835_17150 [bacterium]|nr:hypothetical protein [bacterium]
MWVLVLYIVGGLFTLGLAILLFFFAFMSRRRYRCPQCGERISTEYLNAKYCGMCGVELKQEA